MAYDEKLAERIRTLLDGQPVTEKKMFGGLAFLVDGNMMEVRGRAMSGWLRVSTDVLDDATLRTWVDRGVSYAASLPPK